jgi:hypothetical protein
MPETPIFLYKLNKDAKALKVLKSIYKPKFIQNK